MKKPHQVIIKWEESTKKRTQRHFKTKAEADAFIDGVTTASQIDGMSGFTYTYKDKNKIRYALAA